LRGFDLERVRFDYRVRQQPRAHLVDQFLRLLLRLRAEPKLVVSARSHTFYTFEPKRPDGPADRDALGVVHRWLQRDVHPREEGLLAALPVRTAHDGSSSPVSIL